MRLSIILSSALAIAVAIGIPSSDTLAQNKDPKAVHLLARRNDSTVSVRWGPSTSAFFAQAKTEGYRLERAPMNGNSVGTFEVLNEGQPLKPWPDGAWAWFISQLVNPDSTRMMYLHIGYSMLFSDSANNALNATPQERREALESQFSYAMLAADRDSLAAIGLGMRFEDWLMQPSQKYMYRITLLGGVPNGIIESDSVIVEPYTGPSKAKTTPLSVDERETSVTIFWNHRAEHTAHRVERSDDQRRSFHPLHSSPLVTLITGDTIPSDQEFYRDTALVTGKTYYYRVYGYNSFGTDDVLGEIKATPRDRTPPTMPTEVHADNIAIGKVKITWQMAEPVDADLIGFHIGKDSVDEGDSTRFRHITTTMLPASAREFVDASGSFFDKNYYVVEAFDTARNMIRSFSAYCVMIDSTPPSAPKLLRGTIDTNGVVTVHFTPPSERDYMGYRLLRANDSTHEFSVVAEHFSNDSVNFRTDSVFTDTIQVRTLTRYVYYKMYALDFHFNESVMSNMLQVERPDVVAPVAPVITGYFVSDSDVTIEFVPSSSSDVAYTTLLRHAEGSARWDSLVRLSPTDRIVRDRSSAVNALYDFALQTVDLAGLRSDTSNIISARRYDNGVRPPVTNLRATYDAANRTVRLAWDYNDRGEDLSFIVYRATTGTLASYKFVRGRATRDFTDAELDGGTTIRYAVKVVAASGAESTLSAPSTVVTR